MLREIYTDGACSQNGTWLGGYGVVEFSDNTIHYHYKFKEDTKTTNNRMELKAMIHALSYATEHNEDTFIIYSDSAYVVNTCNNWIWGWSQHNWLNSKKIIVENVDLMKILYNYLNTNFCKSQVTISKVKGHAGRIGNELADSLAADSKAKWDKLVNTHNITIKGEDNEQKEN